jgi:hypothetical protein
MNRVVEGIKYIIISNFSGLVNLEQITNDVAYDIIEISEDNDISINDAIKRYFGIDI